MTGTDYQGEKIVVTKQVAKITAAEKKAFYASAHAAGVAAGRAAGEAVELPQYVAVERADPLDDSSEIVKVWEQPFELCGFASIQVKGANKGYGKWVVSSGTGQTDSYNGGARIGVVREFGQSYGRKVAYGMAYAKTVTAVLAEAGEEAYVWVWERLD